MYVLCESTALGLLPQVVRAHALADTTAGVAEHPNVPDDQKHASYLAAQRILEVTKAARMDGKFGAFHLVTRVSKWIVLHPKPVEKWKKACNPQGAVN